MRYEIVYTEKTLYANMSTIKTELTYSASESMEWHRRGDTVRVDRGYKYTDIPGAKQPEPVDENRERCKGITEELEAYAEGNVYKCPECDEHIRIPDSVGDKYRCPYCGSVDVTYHYDQLSVWDFLADMLDIEYRIGSDGEYRSVKIMVACGGPNIYIDTASASVKLYWWTDRAEYPISYKARDAVDEYAAELWSCR